MDFSSTSQDQFDQWELDLIKREAEAFKANHRLRWSDASDLKSEGLLAWWRQRPHYDVRRGASKETYLRTVVRHAFADVLKSERAAIRRAALESRSLFAPLTSDSDLTPEDIAAARDDFAQLTVQVDAHEPLGRLTPRQRAVIRGRLEGEGMAELARRLRVSRDTLYQDLQHIRRVFRTSGLFDPTNLPAPSHKAAGGSS